MVRSFSLSFFPFLRKPVPKLSSRRRNSLHKQEQRPCLALRGDDSNFTEPLNEQLQERARLNMRAPEFYFCRVALVGDDPWRNPASQAAVFDHTAQCHPAGIRAQTIPLLGNQTFKAAGRQHVCLGRPTPLDKPCGSWRAMLLILSSSGMGCL